MRGARGGGGGVGPERGRQPAGDGGRGGGEWEDVAPSPLWGGERAATGSPGRSGPGKAAWRAGRPPPPVRPTFPPSMAGRERPFSACLWVSSPPSPPHVPPLRRPAGCPPAGAAALPRPQRCGAGRRTASRGRAGGVSRHRPVPPAGSRGAGLTGNTAAPFAAAGWKRKFAQDGGEGGEGCAQLPRLPAHPPACDCACLDRPRPPESS